jgi:hypothetical protein
MSGPCSAPVPPLVPAPPLACPPPCSASLPFVRSRTVAPCPVPQVSASRGSCEWAPTCFQGPSMPSHFCLMIQHEWIRTCRLKTLFVVPSTLNLTDRLETRQQTLVLLLSNHCCPLHEVASRIASCVRLNSMARNSLVAVSNPVPSSLCRQNLS